MNIFEEIIKKGDFCFDIGANIGNKTQKILNRGAKVLCIEPQKECFEILKERFLENSQVIVANYGCGSSNKKAFIKIATTNTLSSMSEDFIEKTTKERFVGIKWDREEEINLVTLDYLINEYGIPVFCKLDVEGYELEILKGLTHPIKYISAEFVPELKHKTFECMDILKNIGNYVFNYSEGESEVFEFSEWLNYESMKDYLKEKNDFKISFGDLYAKLIN